MAAGDAGKNEKRAHGCSVGEIVDLHCKWFARCAVRDERVTEGGGDEGKSDGRKAEGSVRFSSIRRRCRLVGDVVVD